MHIVARSVPADADVSVWLDRIFDDEHRKHPLRTMLARAEAARWRGDEDAEKRWRMRARKVFELLSNSRRTLLASLAGLR